jgi:hypothetical protein
MKIDARRCEKTTRAERTDRGFCHEVAIQNSPGLQPWVGWLEKVPLPVRRSLWEFRDEGGKVAPDGRRAARITCQGQ